MVLSKGLFIRKEYQVDKPPKLSFIDYLKFILTFPKQIKDLADGYLELRHEHEDLLKQHTELLERNTSLMNDYMELHDMGRVLSGRYEELRNNYEDLLKLQKLPQSSES